MVNKGVIQLIDKMGAEFNIHMKPHQTHTTKTLAKNRAKVELMYDDLDQPLARCPEWAKASALVTVVWDQVAPWNQRQVLRRYFLNANIAEKDVTHLCAWPYEQSLPPTEGQLASIKPHIMEAINASNAKYVLLFGSIGLKLWRRELKLIQMMGKVGVWNNRYIVFVMSTLSTVTRDPELQRNWKEDVDRFTRMVVEDHELVGLMRTCIDAKCDEGVFVYDADGIGWCEKHLQRGIDKKMRNSRKGDEMVNRECQEEMDLTDRQQTVGDE